MKKGGYVYFLANKKNGTIYVGVTANLAQRIHEHKSKTYKGFTAQYDVNKLVYYEPYDDILLAIQREKQIKKWERGWKVKRIMQDNPEWNDLYETING